MRTGVAVAFSGQFLLGSVGAFSLVEAGREQRRHLTGGSTPLCAPRSKSSWSVHCHPSSSGHTSLFMTSPHFLASLLPAFADTTLHVARPEDLPDPTSPARTVPPEAKTNSPEDTSRSVQWPRRSTWKDKRGCSHPAGPGRIMGAQQIARGT